MLKKLIKDIVWNLNKGYKPKDFWDKWADDFIKDPWQKNIHQQHEWILKKIKELKPRQILEVGCGFGRNIKFLRENGIKAKIVGLDISPKMIRKARIFLKDPKINLIVGDAVNLPFKTGNFDLVLVHGVFMHVPPTKINKAVSEVLRVSKKVINIEQNYNGNKFTFIHDYKKIYKSKKAKIIEYVKNKKRGLDYFYVKVR